MQVILAASQLGDWRDGSLITVVFSLLGLVWRIVRKVEQRLDRDETLRADYPPHRHINGTIVYPKEYGPAETGRISI